MTSEYEVSATNALSDNNDIVAINLGIDFGTTYTKVCFRDVETEESRIITFDYEESSTEVAIDKSGNLKGAIIPARVAIDSRGKLTIPDETDSKKTITVPYLKMRLADEVIGEKLPKFKKIDLNEPDCINAMCSWYLANVIVRCQNWLYEYEHDRLKDRNPDWTANVGVPVQYCDSGKIDRFKEVFNVAWHWVMENDIPATLSKVVKRYNEEKDEAQKYDGYINPVPEIQAAVHSFVTSREAIPGLYVYFDIGAGTMDGATFQLKEHDEPEKISYYTGIVEHLGVCVLYEKLTGKSENFVTKEMFENALSKAPRKLKQELEKQIRLLVGPVINRAKQKVPGDWRRKFRDFFSMVSKGYIQPDEDTIEKLPVFIGGGGAKSQWYRDSIESTYEKFKHRRVHIPPYKLIEVPKPLDLDLHELLSEHFFRFVIAYGLSIPFEEYGAFKLPSQVPNTDKPKDPRPNKVDDYSDIKDKYY